MAFKGKVAFVTGGASGMGRMTCERLAAQGAKVFAVDMEENGLASLAEQNPNVTVQKCDVSNYEQVQDAVARASKELGDIDRLTHCAAIMPLDKIVDMSAELIVRQMRINYEGTVYLTKSVLPGMLERNSGDIICFGSIAGEVPLPDCGGYCATKAAVNMYVKQMMYENKKSAIRFLLICPPPVNTSLLSEEKTGKKGFSEKEKAQALKTGVLVQPEFILDQIEKGIEKNKGVLFPGPAAKTIVTLHKFFPKTIGAMMANNKGLA